jgi:predicted transcriptional regulator
LITVNDALDLESRRTIYEMVRSRPGTYLREMERELGMQVGMLTYHLRVLAEAGMIRAEQEGNHLRYFPADGFVLNDRRALSHLRNRTSRAILIHVLDRGSAGFSEILGLVGVSKSTLSYHLKRLAAAGLVTLKKGEVMSISAVDPERLVNLLVWVREDLERDSADALVDVWNRLNER